MHLILGVGIMSHNFYHLKDVNVLRKSFSLSLFSVERGREPKDDSSHTRVDFKAGVNSFLLLPQSGATKTICAEEMLEPHGHGILFFWETPCLSYFLSLHNRECFKCLKESSTLVKNILKSLKHIKLGCQCYSDRLLGH